MPYKIKAREKDSALALINTSLRSIWCKAVLTKQGLRVIFKSRFIHFLCNNYKFLRQSCVVYIHLS